MADSLASTRFDCAAALLCSVSSSAVRAAGTFASAGVPRVGGDGAGGGESQSSLFCSLGGFVHVDPGGLGGAHVDLQSIAERNTSPHNCGGTILGSRGGSMTFGSMTLRSSRMEVVVGAKSGHLSPLSFQGGIGRKEGTGIGLAGISLDGLPPVYECDDRLRVVKVGKTFSLVAYPTMSPMHIVIPGLHQEDVCGGIIGGGSCFCTKLAHDCHYSNHRANKMWESRPMDPGYYIHDDISCKAYSEPYLPMAVASLFPTDKAVLEECGKTLETWTTIFRHLQDKAKEAEGLVGSWGAKIRVSASLPWR